MIDEPIQGEILLVNKPLGWSSFQVVKKVKWLIKAKKVGHAGTLDPLATGLLILCTEKFTKRIAEIQDADKEYIGTITLGSTTASYDLESTPENFVSTTHISEEMIQNATLQFTGEISQAPPLFSAIKVNGQRAYTMARGGSEQKLAARPVRIDLFEITKIEMPLLYFRVVCGKGTYIRSLANDFGKALGCGGHLSSLVRTRIGEFKLEQAKTPAEIAEGQ